MADYHTEFSFIVPMDEFSAARLAPQIQMAIDEFEDYDDLDPHPIFQHEEYGFPYIEIVEDGLWFTSDAGESSAMTACEIVRWVLEQLPDGGVGHIEFEWASTCSKPRVDAFGGGAAYVNKLGWEAIHTSSLTWHLENLMKTKGYL